ncbi:unnamed protein product [Rhizophagus irregularis]|uniref:Uncharacterized protein n=1 Tax=Rhizophagus irregularis TaxID=588596 RepID=A0A2N1P2Z8_9GLOM|nr:hypothetical protein RhiirC2_2294 [Rhizophagus irregularis]CAB4377236.1 unnamed protein product [Rhizophagus irregularis]CAB5383333.1 unnamed protein product [Rhizophagus irregularis]
MRAALCLKNTGISLRPNKILSIATSKTIIWIRKKQAINKKQGNWINTVPDCSKYDQNTIDPNLCVRINYCRSRGCYSLIGSNKFEIMHLSTSSSICIFVHHIIWFLVTI